MKIKLQLPKVASWGTACFLKSIFNAFSAKNYTVVLLAFAISSYQNGYAQTDDGIEDPSISNQFTGVTDLAPGQSKFLIFSPGYEQRHTIKNIVSLRLKEEIPAFIAQNFTAIVKVKIEYGHDASNPTIIPEQALTVSYNKEEEAKFAARNYFHFSNAEYVKITVNSVTPVDVGSIKVADLLVLENEMRVTRHYDLATTASHLQPTFTTPSPVAVATGDDELPVGWIWPQQAGQTHTQLEWTWVEDELLSDYLVNGMPDYNQMFRNNATRIDLLRGKNNYSIPLLYGGTGKVYFRIRAVNIKNDKTRTDGPWSDVQQSTTFLGHNDKLNWQSTISFAEEGKRKAVVQYFDGSLRSRQTVTKDNVTGITTAAETLYDGQGRPAIQILPAPGINAAISYTKNLNLFNTQNPDTDHPAKLFDLRPETGPVTPTPALNTGSGAARYYSSSNTGPGADKFIPDAEGYPYTQTVYMPDGTGRVMAQGGVGKAMQIGNKHETKYYYGTPSQEELNGLFGTEVGYKTHYFKNMVQDANGQISVSYVDMHGRTIATALAGEAPGNLVSLDKTQYSNQDNNTIFQDLLDGSNVIKNNSIDAINTILVPFPTLYTFNYKLTPDKLELTSCTNVQLCYDCMYDLEISITDESGETLPIVRRYNNISINPDDDCNTASSSLKDMNTSYPNNEISFSETLQRGSYIIRKTLTISEASVEKYKETVLSKILCKTEQELIDSVYTAMKASSNCDAPPPANTCDACTTALGDYNAYKSKYLLTAPSTPESEILASFKADKLNCDRLCNKTSQTLATKRQLMLADMVPYRGQYATEAPVFKDNGIAMHNTWNIFATGASGQPFYKYPWKGIGQSDFYRTSTGEIDLNIKQQPVELSKEEFAHQFTYSWAEALLPHHPEYARLDFAEKNLVESYNWINDFMNLDYNKAFFAGYFTNSPANSDPFFVKDNLHKGEFATKVTSNYQQGMSMWKIAYGNAVCKSILSDALRNQCFASAPQIPGDATYPPFSDLTQPQKEEVWNTFKGLYANERDNYVNKYIADNVPLPNDAALINEKFILHFPKDQQQMATQLNQQDNGAWSWYSPNPAQPVNPSGMPVSTAADVYASRCGSYMDRWIQTLKQCPELSDDFTGRTEEQKQAILNQIAAAMKTVCEKGSDAANPYGSSTVAPSTPVDGSFRSFEEAIFKVLNDNGIAITNLCNPYVIEFPKPYGKGPVVTKEVVTVLEKCNCDRFSLLKSEAIAQGKDPNVLSSFNEYLQAAYGETLTQDLYDAMVENCSKLGRTACVDSTYRIAVNCNDPIPCGCAPVTISGICYIDCSKRVCPTSTESSFILASPQPMPEFLKCGFTGEAKCITCADISALVSEFKQKIPASYSAGPFFSNTSLTDDQVRDNVLFARFVNYRTGFQYNWTDYARKAKDANCNLANYPGNGGAIQTVICRNDKPLNDGTGIITTETPCDKIYNMSVALAQNIYQIRKEILLADFEKAYRAKCLVVENIESFTVEYAVKEYHYTLYYYDMAGNLVKTVPPKGVRPDFRKVYTDQVDIDREAGTYNPRPHVLTTNYRYNSLNAVIAQHSPDANTSEFWYDKLGRLAVSQNAQQKLDGKYSYTLYDELGRIKEVGQKPQTVLMNQTISQDPEALNNWIVTGGDTREQITITEYDVPNSFVDATYITQQNLRNRVSYTATKNLATDAFPYTATYYTYDVHGNVDKLLQDYRGIAETGTNNRFKLIEYEYDLVSGKVNKVNYQKNMLDAFYHKYSYDAENRLTSVWTSRDAIYWEQDATYNYYKHGPLSRTELGQLKVQGMDYAYTLQGWLKGVNSTNLNAVTDMGQDGYNTGAIPVVAKDVLGFSLHYFDDANGFMDYQSINSPSPFARPGNGAFTSLYNGNIGAISINNGGLLKASAATTNSLPLFYNYRYDQLNRLVSMQAYKGLQAASNTWAPIAIDDYKEGVKYDPNGNILTYNRNGAPAIGKPKEMDDLAYEYYPDNNQLKRVSDNVAYDGNYAEDIDHQAELENYVYDKIGNLVKDLKEGIGTGTTNGITWNVYGKILSIVKNGNTISYTYDAAGNRITKTANGKTTLYVRDASGNVMSVYEAPVANTDLKQTEVHLYGSSRLGMAVELTTTPQEVHTVPIEFGTAKISTFTRGEKLFELTNHLGNVLVTVSDRKLLQMPAGYETENCAPGTGVDVLNISERGTGATMVARQEVNLLEGFISTDNDDLTVYIDNTINVCTPQSTTTLPAGVYYKAVVLSATDYYPFGMQMPGRSYTNGNNSYRYGFNGKEHDKETSSTTTYDYGFRIYSPALARFLSVDPLTLSYPYYTPYQFAGNKPIAAIDLDGLEEYVVIYYKNQDQRTTKIQVRAVFDNNGEILDQNIHKVGSTESIAKGNVLVFEASKNQKGRYILSIVKKRNVANSSLTTQEKQIFKSNKSLETEQGQTEALSYPDIAPNNQYESKPFENSDTKSYKATKVLNFKLNSYAVYLYNNPGPTNDNGALAYDYLEGDIKQLPKDLKEDGTVKSLTITLTYYINADLSASEINNFRKGVENAGQNLKKYLESKGVKQEINIQTNTSTYTPDYSKEKGGRPANNSIEVKLNR